MPTNRQVLASIRVMRILNREIGDPDKLDKVLKEIEEVIEKGDTEADQSQTVSP